MQIGKIAGLLKDLFLVYDDYGKNGQRISNTMRISAAGIVAGVLVVLGIIPMDMEGEFSAQILGFITVLWNVYLMRQRLKGGGEIKLKSELGKQGANRVRSRDERDEHIPEILNDD